MHVTGFVSQTLSLQKATLCYNLDKYHYKTRALLGGGRFALLCGMHALKIVTVHVF